MHELLKLAEESSLREEPLSFVIGDLVGVHTRRLGGGTVQTPGFFSGRAKELLGNITNDKAAQMIIDAVQDKELFQALLRGVGPRALREVNKRLNAWLLGPGSRVFEGEGAE